MSDCLIITGAQSGHEKKRSLSDHQETFIRSSSGSTSDEFLPREVSLKASCDLFIGFH